LLVELLIKCYLIILDSSFFIAEGNDFMYFRDRLSLRGT